MRVLPTVVVTFAVALLTACVHTPEVTLEDVLGRNAKARGGPARLEALRAMRLEVHIQEPTFEVSGTYVATHAGHMRVDVYAGEQRVFTEALGPDGGWQWHGAGEEILPLSAEGEAALRRGVVNNLQALYLWPLHGYTLALTPAEEAGYWQVVADEGDGFVRRIWIDRESHLVAREYERSALHPDIDSTETEQYSVVREWMQVDGLLLPRITEKIDVASGEVIQRSEVISARLHFEGDETPAWLSATEFGPPALPTAPSPAP